MDSNQTDEMWNLTTVSYDVTMLLFNGSTEDSDSTSLFNETIPYGNQTSSISKSLYTNSSSDDNSTSAVPPLPKYSESMLGFTAFCAFLIAIFGTIGNLLTILALPMNKKLRTTNTAFVINLAFVELCYCVFILPMNGIQYAYLQHTGDSLLSDTNCIFSTVARYTFTQADLQTIIGIAVYRAIAVGCPSFYQKINNMTVTGIYISLIWIYSFAIKLPTGLGIFGRYVFNNRTLKCDLAQERESFKARGIALIVEAFIPVLLILFLYTFIFIMVRRSSNRVSKLSKKMSVSSASRPSVSTCPNEDGTETTQENTDSDVGTNSKRRGSIRSIKKMASDVNAKLNLTRRSSSITHCIATNRRDMRVARSIFIIFVMILVCSFPVAINHSLDPYVRHPSRLLFLHILYWLPYCLNIVIYVLMNQQYRDAYVDFIAKYLPSCKRHQGFTFPWEAPSTATSLPPTLLNNSPFKAKKDQKSKEENKIENGNQNGSASSGKQHRLSAIVEASSHLSDDDVFGKEGLEKNGNALKLEFKSDEEEEEECKDGTSKKTEEKGSEEEKELWLNKNGAIEQEPDDGVVV